MIFQVGGAFYFYTTKTFTNTNPSDAVLVTVSFVTLDSVPGPVEEVVVSLVTVSLSPPGPVDVVEDLVTVSEE